MTVARAAFDHLTVAASSLEAGVLAPIIADDRVVIANGDMMRMRATIPMPAGSRELT